MSLEAAGLGSEQERAYRMLVRLGEATGPHLAEVLGAGDVAVKELLADLQDLGLVTSIDGDPVRYAPTPPDVGFAPLLLGGSRPADRPSACLTSTAREPAIVPG